MVALMSRIGKVSLKMGRDSVCLHLAALKSTLIGLVGELSCEICTSDMQPKHLCELQNCLGPGSCWIKKKP